jgi:hypothetical protein
VAWVGLIACEGLDTSSPGDKHDQGESLCGPVQWRHECETLYEIGHPMSLMREVDGLGCIRKCPM